MDAVAYDLNTPLRIVWKDTGGSDVIVSDQPFVHVSGARAVCETLKPGNGGSVILRLFEPDGAGGPVTLRFRNRIGAAHLCDLLENPVAPTKAKGRSVSLELAPFEIVTLRIDLEQNQMS